MEVIYLSSDDCPQSEPSSPNLIQCPCPGNVRRSNNSAGKNEQGSKVWSNSSVSPELRFFPDPVSCVNEGVDATPFRVWRKEIIDPMRREEDPIASWGGNSQNVTTMTSSKRSRQQIQEDDDVIILDHTPAKAPGRLQPSPVGPFPTQDGGFTTTTASILADILESKTSSDAELSEIDRLLRRGDRGQSSNTPNLNHTLSSIKKRRSIYGNDNDIQDSGGTFNKMPKKTRIGRDNGELNRPPGSPSRKKASRLTEDEREKRAEEKARNSAKKEAEKQAKRVEKEAKALEKQKELELDIVNKLKASKNDSIKEIIVDISESFAQSPPGQQLLRFLESQGCESTVDWNSPIPNVIKWRRKVVADWNEELGYFIPIPESIREEKHILVVVKAADFVDMSVRETDIDDHVNEIKALLGGGGIKPIYVIEGLTTLLRKSRNAKNRTFQGAVRQAIGASPEESNSGNSRAGASRARKGSKVIDENMVEDALLGLQITHGCLVHHTASVQETSEWITVFTGDMSTIPYKLARMNHDTSFCADVGQVRTGNDVEDTYFKMLQEITRVTAGVANGIMGEYKNVRELMNACRDEGEVVIADLEIMANKTGLSSGRKIGQATSKRVHRFFTGLDPDSTDL